MSMDMIMVPFGRARSGLVRSGMVGHGMVGRGSARQGGEAGRWSDLAFSFWIYANA